MKAIHVHVAGYPDSDAQERGELTARLQDALEDAEVERVSRPAGRPLPGAKGEALEWAQLIVTLAGSLPAAIVAIRGWLARHPGAAITVEIDGDRLTLSEPTVRERREVIDAWMKRHG